MDLIYMNGKKEDIGVMKNYTFDLAFGFDENDFELETNTNNHVCKSGDIVYIENTEYGGIIDKIMVQTSTDKLVYKGRTWHGILASKIIEPDSGEDYLVCSGDVHTVIGFLINRMGLNDLFSASAEPSDFAVKSFKMDRYINGYEGIKKLLKSVNAKPKITFKGGFAVLSAQKLVDYSQDDEFDSSQLDFDIEKNFRPVNHVICLGKGELKDRVVLHLYADASGAVSHIQTFSGLDEVTKTYDNANVESVEELEEGGTKALQDEWNTDKLQVDFDSERNYDIGDIVGAHENTTGIFVARPIIKKIVSINDNMVKISHKVGEDK